MLVGKRKIAEAVMIRPSLGTPKKFSRVNFF